MPTGATQEGTDEVTRRTGAVHSPWPSITGSVLLAFAWAMLALLSARRTNQPQRWATVPAVFMAVTGGGILAFAPTRNQLF